MIAIRCKSHRVVSLSWCSVGEMWYVRRDGDFRGMFRSVAKAERMFVREVYIQGGCV